MKWAFTYMFGRHVERFMGPFDSYDDMMRQIISLTDPYADDPVSDAIANALLDYPSSGEAVRDIGIKIFKVSEEPVPAEEIQDVWRKEIDRLEAAWKKQMEEELEREDRQRYERLKKKYEGNPE